MVRKRAHFTGALYHVISRGNQWQDIFLDDQDLNTFLSYLFEYKVRYPFHLYAYSLMKNHFHLLLEVEGFPLSKIMQSLLFRYTRYSNKEEERGSHHQMSLNVRLVFPLNQPIMIALLNYLDQLFSNIFPH